MALLAHTGFDFLNEGADVTTWPNSDRIRHTNPLLTGRGTFVAAAQRLGTGLGLRQASATGAAAIFTDCSSLAVNVRPEVLAGRTVFFEASMFIRSYANCGIFQLFSTDGFTGQVPAGISSLLGVSVSPAGYAQLYVGSRDGGGSTGQSPSNLVQSSTAFVPLNQWVRIKWQMTFNPDNTLGVALYNVTNFSLLIDEQVYLTSAAPGAIGDISDMVIGVGYSASNSMAGVGNVDWEDWSYISDEDTGDGINSFLSQDARISTFKASAEDVVTGFARAGGTGVADSVAVFSNGNVYTGPAAGNIAIFSSTDTLDVNPAQIYAASVINIARKTDAGARAAAGQIRIASTNYDGPTVDLATSFTQRLSIFTTNPATSSAWTQSGVESASFGIEVIS